MSAVQRSRRHQSEKSTSPRKSPRKPKQPATSAYFEQQDSDASTAEDSVTKPPARATTKKDAKRKRKIEDEEDYDDDEASEATPPPKKIYDSDALDEDSDFGEATKIVKKTRSSSNPTPKKKSQSPRKKKKVAAESDVEFEDELKEGQEVVGVVVQAPKTGRVPPGQISQNTLDFLTKLKDPACNDREWFKLHEPVYRLAEKEWKDFVEVFTDVLAEVDSQIPHLPPKDVIHRIYRDIRFSNDKTPYKKGVSASFSRSGRKGIFAGYHIAVKPGNESLIAAGSWCPGKNELATIRLNIQRNPHRLRNVIAAPEFVKFFGKAKPHPKGERQNIFGMEDELKVAPKGVGKDHKDIDLLKCRSFAVVHKFTDSEVLASDFKEKLADVARVMQPLVHCLNDMMTIIGAGGGGGGGEDVDDDEGEDGEEAE